MGGVSTLGPGAESANMNLDCVAGKHTACRGDAWSLSADKPIDCVCPCHHPEPPC